MTIQITSRHFKFDKHAFKIKISLSLYGRHLDCDGTWKVMEISLSSVTHKLLALYITLHIMNMLWSAEILINQCYNESAYGHVQTCSLSLCSLSFNT